MRFAAPFLALSFALGCNEQTFQRVMNAPNALASGTMKLRSKRVPSLEPVKRRYVPGERLGYEIKMQEVVDGQLSSSYRALAQGSVKQAPSGELFEEWSWKHLEDENGEVPLSPYTQSFRQVLSLGASAKLEIPEDLTRIDRPLMGPVTDLLTSYVDAALAIKQLAPGKAGDRVYLRSSVLSSWGLGQDCIDFDITILEIDEARTKAKVRISHVPPTKFCIKPPADWMKAQVADTPNNWYTTYERDGQWVAQVGKEIFHVELELNLDTGAIKSAKMENPIIFTKRVCQDLALNDCSEPSRHRLVRELTLTPVQP